MLMRKETNKSYNKNNVPRIMTEVYKEWEKSIPLNYRVKEGSSFGGHVRIMNMKEDWGGMEGILNQRYARLEIMFYLIDEFFKHLNLEAKYLYIVSSLTAISLYILVSFKELKFIQL